jgi:hypothetical protein
MVEIHEKHADCGIAVEDVPWSDVHQYEVMGFHTGIQIT